MNTVIDTAELRAKILLGLNKTFHKLVLAKQKADGELIFSEGGKIIVVKARQFRSSSSAQ